MSLDLKVKIVNSMYRRFKSLIWKLNSDKLSKNDTNLSIGIAFKSPDSLNPNDILDFLKRNGYEIEDRGILPIPYVKSLPIVANKGDLTVIYTRENGFLAIRGNSIKETVEGFFKLSTTIQKDLEFDLTEIMRGIEILLQSRVNSKNKPRDTISRFLKSDEKTNFFDSIFKDTSALVTLRAVPKNRDADDNTKWYDLTIEPFFANPSQYLIRLLYRSNNISEIEKFATEDINHIIEDVIKHIEKE